MAPFRILSCRVNATCMAWALCSQSLVEPSISVNRKVTVPVGGLATNSISSLLPLREHYSSGGFSGPSLHPTSTSGSWPTVGENQSFGLLKLCLSYSGILYTHFSGSTYYLIEGSGTPTRPCSWLAAPTPPTSRSLWDTRPCNLPSTATPTGCPRWVGTRPRV